MGLATRTQSGRGGKVRILTVSSASAFCREMRPDEEWSPARSHTMVLAAASNDAAVIACRSTGHLGCRVECDPPAGGAVFHRFVTHRPRPRPHFPSKYL